jgi:hypothetical protein
LYVLDTYVSKDKHNKTCPTSTFTSIPLIRLDFSFKKIKRSTKMLTYIEKQLKTMNLSKFPLLAAALQAA